MLDPFQMETDGAAAETLASLRLCSTHRRRSSTRPAQRTAVTPETESLPGRLRRPLPPLTRSERLTPELAGIPDRRGDACLSGRVDDRDLTSVSVGHVLSCELKRTQAARTVRICRGVLANMLIG